MNPVELIKAYIEKWYIEGFLLVNMDNPKWALPLLNETAQSFKGSVDGKFFFSSFQMYLKGFFAKKWM